MRRLIGAALTAIALLCCARAALAGGLHAELDVSTPQATYRSFLSETGRIKELFLAYQAEPTIAREATLALAIYRLGNRFFDLSDLPPASHRKAATRAVIYMADILNRLPEIAASPAAGGATPARWTIPGTEIRISRLTEGPRAGDYVFSPETHRRLPEFHAQIIQEKPQRATSIVAWRQTLIRMTGPMLASLPLASLPEPAHALLLDAPI